MAKKKLENKKKKSFWHYLWKIILFILKIPYYLIKGIFFSGKQVYFLIKKTNQKIKEKNMKKEIAKKRGKMFPVYREFKVLKEISGEYPGWEKNIFESESKIGIILGARGSGKSAFGIKFLENLRAKKNKKCYAMGFKESEMPDWIEVVNNVDQIKNDAFILIDEGGILFSSRKSMSSANKILSDLILIARHKNLNILFISQNSSNLDVNILRQADYLVLKPSSLLQKDFERKIVQKLYEQTKNGFEKFKNEKGITYIYSNNFKGFISNPLPSFWGVNISKAFR